MYVSIPLRNIEIRFFFYSLKNNLILGIVFFGKHSLTARQMSSV